MTSHPVKLLMQVSRVAYEQPDDPPKCGLDEGTRVCCSHVCDGRLFLKPTSDPTLTLYRAEVMDQLIQSSDLFVMQVEMDVYTALKKVDFTFPRHALYHQTCF